LVEFSVLIKERLAILSSISQALNWLCRGLLLLLLPLTVFERHALRLNVRILLLMRVELRANCLVVFVSGSYRLFRFLQLIEALLVNIFLLKSLIEF
jgi:hypothetical protein